MDSFPFPAADQANAPGQTFVEASLTPSSSSAEAGPLSVHSEAQVQPTQKRSKKRPRKKNRVLVTLPFTYTANQTRQGPSAASSGESNESHDQDHVQPIQSIQAKEIRSTLVSSPSTRLQHTLARPPSSPLEANSMAAHETRPQAGLSADLPMYSLSGVQPPERLFQPASAIQRSQLEAPSGKLTGSIPQLSAAPLSNTPQNSTSSTPEKKVKETPDASLVHKWQTMTIGEVNGIPVVSDNKTSNKAQGESILRATVHVLSRDFTWMSKELFLMLYQQLFGSPRPGDMDKLEVQSFLGSKTTTDFIQVMVKDNTKWYRLNPAYFENITTLLSLPPLMTMDNLFFSMSNRMGLPPIRPMDPRIVANMVTQLEPKLISIGWRYDALCPSRILDSEPLYDLRRYLTVWHPISPPNLSGHTIQAANSTTQDFGELLQKARGCGMEAKNARKYLSSHSSKMLDPIERERQEEIARMLKLCERVHSDDSNSSMTTDRGTSKRVERVFATRQVYELIDSDNDMDVDDIDFCTSTRNPRVSTTAGRTVREDNEKATASEKCLEGTLDQERQTKRWPESGLTQEVAQNSTRPAKLESPLKPMFSMRDPCGSKSGNEFNDESVSDPESRTSLQSPISTSRPIDHGALISAAPGLPISQDSLLKRRHTEGQPFSDQHAMVKLMDRIEFVDLTKVSDKEGDPSHVNLKTLKNISGLHAEERVDSRKHDHVMAKTQGLTSRKLGVSKPNQEGQRQISKQQRFRPYPGAVQANEISSYVNGNSSDSGNVPSTQGGKALGYIPPSEDGVFTLPRPILPPLDRKGIRPSGNLPTVQPPDVSIVGREESNLTMAGQLLSTTRDQILKARRAALDEIIDFAWKMPLNVDRVGTMNHAAPGLPSSSTAQR